MTLRLADTCSWVRMCVILQFPLHSGSCWDPPSPARTGGCLQKCVLQRQHCWEGRWIQRNTFWEKKLGGFHFLLKTVDYRRLPHSIVALLSQLPVFNIGSKSEMSNRKILKIRTPLDWCVFQCMPMYLPTSVFPFDSTKCVLFFLFPWKSCLLLSDLNTSHRSVK